VSTRPYSLDLSHAKARSVLLALLLITACGGAKATPTSAPATATVVIPTAVGAKPLFLTPGASRSGSAVSPSATGVTPPGGIVYTDPQGRFSFTAPDGYQQIANPPGPPNPSNGINVATFVAPGNRGGLIVSVQDVNPTDEHGTPVTGVPPTVLLDLKTRVVWGATSQLPGFEPLTGQAEGTTWAGQPAREFEARFVDTDGRTYHILVTGTLHASQYWTMNIQLEDKDYAATIDRARVALDTFTFLQ
jgi:hypothetical protein